MKNKGKIVANALLILAGTIIGIFIAVMQPDRGIHPANLAIAGAVGTFCGLLCRKPAGGLVLVPLAYVIYLFLAPPL